MFVVWVIGSKKETRVKDAGEFFCLHCMADRSYSLREWRRTFRLFVLIPLSTTGGEFVLCSTCETAFDPECLDESSTKELDELEVDVPGFACGPMGPPGAGSSRPQFSANSAFRRH